MLFFNTNDQRCSFWKSGVWSPGQRRNSPPIEFQKRVVQQNSKDEPIPPVWTPRSAGSSPLLERKEFRPVNFESPVLGRKNKPRLEVCKNFKDKATQVMSSKTWLILESKLSRQFISRTAVESTILQQWQRFSPIIVVRKTLTN